MPTTTLAARCPAKVNLALSVGAPAANGYHPIASWMVAVDLFDDLALTRLDGRDAAEANPADAPGPGGPAEPAGDSTYDIAWADDAPQPTPIDWPVESDLIVKAHRLVEAAVGRSLPVAARLRKRVPVGAGLAGGSSDGAAMLAGLDRLFALNLGDGAMIELASRLGSDLAFFFSTGSAIVGGFGERLEPWPAPEEAGPVHLALLMPPLHCGTGAVYRAFDAMSPGASVDEASVRAAAGPPIAPFNDLAEPACAVEPALAEVRRVIARAVERPVHVTGSGAGLFIVADDGAEAAYLAAAAQAAAPAPSGVAPALAARAVKTIALPPRAEPASASSPRR